MSKHTPGPWMVEAREYAESILAGIQKLENSAFLTPEILAALKTTDDEVWDAVDELADFWPTRSNFAPKRRSAPKRRESE